MHVALTEILRCGACGEGLVLLTDAARGGRTTVGTLGCSGCGARYPVRAGVADLRGAGTAPDVRAEAGVPERANPAAARGSEAPDGPRDRGGDPERRPDGPAAPWDASADADGALRLAALLGLQDARGVVLLVSPLGAHAEALARLVPGVEVVVADPGAPSDAAAPAGPATSRISPILTTPELPLTDRRVTGVALSSASHVGLAEAVRVLAPGHRVLVTDARRGLAREAEELGCAVIVHERGVLVAERGGEADPPRLYQLA